MLGWFGKKKTATPPLQPFKPSSIPDSPTGFSYKTAWIAVRGEPSDLVDALQLLDPVAANWETGLGAAYDYGRNLEARPLVFVTPVLDGWTFAVSLSLPALDESVTVEQLEGRAPPGERSGKFIAMMNALASRFDDVQYFWTYRVVEHHAWALAKGGKLIRVFGFGDGVMANLGEQTAGEAKLGFLNLSGLALEEATDKIFEREDAIPNEEWVTRLAGEWSMNPHNLEDAGYPPSVGLAGFLPDRFWNR